MNSLVRSMVAFSAAALLAVPASAQVRVKLEQVADGLVHPLVMAWPDDGSKRRFITEQTGAIWIQTPDGKMSGRPFLDLAGKIIPLDREFDERGLMRLRVASINDQPIRESDRKFRWPQGPRPADHPGLSDLNL